METVTSSGTGKGWLISLGGSILAAIGASLCCVVPLVFVMLGVGGAWLSSLQWFEPYRWYFIGAMLACLVLAFYFLYLGPSRSCAPDKACAEPRVRRRQRILFWSVTVVLLVLIVFPWFAPLFY